MSTFCIKTLVENRNYGRGLWNMKSPMSPYAMSVLLVVLAGVLGISCKKDSEMKFNGKLWIDSDEDDRGMMVYDLLAISPEEIQGPQRANDQLNAQSILWKKSRQQVDEILGPPDRTIKPNYDGNITYEYKVGQLVGSGKLKPYFVLKLAFDANDRLEAAYVFD